MAKKKQKKNNEAQHKALLLANIKKQELLFWKKAGAIAEAVGAGNALDFLPEKDKRDIVLTRFHPLRAESAEGLKVPTRIIKLVQGLINMFLTKYTFSFPGSEKEFPMADYFTVVLSIYHRIRIMGTKGHPQHGLLATAFKPLLDLCTSDDCPQALLNDYLDVAGNCLTQPDKIICFLDNSIISRRYPRVYVACTVTVTLVIPEPEHALFPEGRRPVYLMVFLKQGVRHAGIKTGVLHPGSAFPDMELKVYFQKHAMDRLRERIDCFNFDTVYVKMCESFESPEAIPAGNMKALVSFNFYGAKLGYFVVELCDGMAVVRTFLFLTNDSTPEGKKLQQILGLQRRDKQYTGLDKLSTFLLTDLAEDADLRQLLTEAGCQGLLRIDLFLVKSAKAEPGSRLLTAQHIKEYLMLNSTQAT